MPGIHNFDSSAILTGALVLDFAGDPTASFVFQIGTTLEALSGDAGGGLVGSSARQLVGDAVLVVGLRRQHHRRTRASHGV